MCHFVTSLFCTALDCLHIFQQTFGITFCSFGGLFDNALMRLMWKICKFKMTYFLEDRKLKMTLKFNQSTNYLVTFTFSTLSVAKCASASGDRDDWWGPRATASHISSFDHGLPVFVGHPSCAHSDNSSPAGCDVSVMYSWLAKYSVTGILRGDGQTRGRVYWGYAW